MLKAKMGVFFTGTCMWLTCACSSATHGKISTYSPPCSTSQRGVVPLSMPSPMFSKAPTARPAQSSKIREAVEIVTQIRNEVPTADKSVVELFAGPLGYTLIGKKPVSFDDYNLDEDLVFALRRSFLHRDGFVLHIKAEGTKRREICLIHKRSFLKLAQQEKIIVGFLSKKKMSAQHFLNMFAESTSSFEDFCDRDPIVIGILLGFGSQNAQFWTRWAELGFFLRAWPFSHPSPIPSPLLITMPLPGPQCLEAISIPQMNPEFSALYSEWNWLNTHKKTFNPLPVPSCIPLPAFLFWEGHEEQVSRFMHARDILAKVFLRARIYR